MDEAVGDLRDDSGVRAAAGPLGGPVAAHLIDRRGRCRLAFEPIADLARGTICGYEAVERFPVAPDPETWREAALRRGLDPDFDAFVVASVLHARESLPRGCFLAFKILPATLLREAVRHVLLRADTLDGLAIELSPRVARRDASRLVAAVAELRAAGATFAVDGVGGADGVLRHYALVRPELVKLDGALVADLHREPEKLALIDWMERLASRFGTSLVAQGVTQVDEIDALLRLRVPLAQGTLIGVRAKTLTPIAFALSAYVRERGAALLEPGSLAALVESAPPSETIEDVAAAFAADEGLRWVALVDGARRPVGLVERTAFARGEPPVPDPLAVAASNGIAEVAQRAMLRPAAIRFHPLVCCDARGSYLGLVHVERLVDALARAADRGVERSPS
jgi:EAL domain-containing protein (putative c-di-GMP-specific phosphodiesterase class I)